MCGHNSEPLGRHSSCTKRKSAKEAPKLVLPSWNEVAQYGTPEPGSKSGPTWNELLFHTGTKTGQLAANILDGLKKKK